MVTHYPRVWTIRQFCASRRLSWALTTGRLEAILQRVRGAVAQLGERINRTDEAKGSSPFSSTRLHSRSSLESQRLRTGAVGHLRRDPGGGCELGGCPGERRRLNLPGSCGGEGSSRRRWAAVTAPWRGRSHGAVAQWESTCLADKGSRVQIPSAPPSRISGPSSRVIPRGALRPCWDGGLLVFVG